MRKESVDADLAKSQRKTRVGLHCPGLRKARDSVSRHSGGTAEKGRGGRGADGWEVRCSTASQQGRKEDGAMRVRKGPD